ncbi:MAG: hypothetical protein LC114_20520 [Bryobacterales bacterium]|nr:hypothetical protein [Bryobacterales bacterium]
MDAQLTPEILATLQRLADAGFDLVPDPELRTHYIIRRGDYLAMVERRPDGSFGGSGSPGKLTTRGFAPLVRHGEQAVFRAKRHDEPASQEEVRAIRSFAAELKQALSGQ